MSYQVTFWTFAKKTNSTKQPTSAGTVYTCEVMDGSGILNPTIKLNTGLSDPSAFDYARITAWSRYYFITNWRYDRGLWWADLTEDILASYKTAIGSLSMYVLRSSYEFDGRIVDTKYPTKAGASFTVTQNNSNPFSTTFSSGYFVVGIINNDSSAIGIVSYYVFTSAEFRAFAAFMLGDESYLDSPAEISAELLKCLVNPTQYIVSCTWLPVTPPMGAAVTTINIGWWSISGMSAHYLSGYTRSAGSVTISVPKHPDAATRGYYLLQEPFSSYYLDFPPFGSISIAANALVDTTALDLYYDVDCITGKGRLDIRGGPTGHIGTITIIQGQVGVPVLLAQNAPNIGGATQESVNGITGTLADWVEWGVDKISPYVGNKTDFLSQMQSWPETIRGAGSGSSNIANAAAAILMPFQTIGGNGGYMSGYYPIRMIGTFATLVADNNSEWGKPLCQIRTLSNIPGYILCAESDFEIACTAPERASISSFLTTGFYYE